MSYMGSPEDGGFGESSSGPGSVVPSPGGIGEPPAPLDGFWVRLLGFPVDGVDPPRHRAGPGVALDLRDDRVGGWGDGPRGHRFLPHHGDHHRPGGGLRRLVLDRPRAGLGQLLGIRVVDSETVGPAGPSQAVARWIGYLISGIPRLRGFIGAALDARKQVRMEKPAGTKVIRSRWGKRAAAREPGREGRSSPAPSPPTRGSPSLPPGRGRHAPPERRRPHDLERGPGRAAA